MEVEQVLHMNGGSGDRSYATNSLVQGKVIEMTKPIVEDAINQVYCSCFPFNSNIFSMAELGCSSGPNTLLVAAEVVKTVHDWSVPEGLEMNKGNVYIGSESPESVIEAYYDQFRRDFGTFLKCRSEEVVVGGRMVLTILGRKSERATSKECSYIWELLALALNEMVSEGIVEEEIVNSFNIPQYTPSPREIKKEVEEEGSFIITHLEASEISWAACAATNDNANHKINAYNVAKCMRSVAEPLLLQHFGESIIDYLFTRYQQIICDRMSREETKFINVTVSLTKTLI